MTLPVRTDETDLHEGCIYGTDAIWATTKSLIQQTLQQDVRDVGMHMLDFDVGSFEDGYPFSIESKALSPLQRLMILYRPPQILCPVTSIMDARASALAASGAALICASIFRTEARGFQDDEFHNPSKLLMRFRSRWRSGHSWLGVEGEQLN